MIQYCLELWCRVNTGSDPALLWLWHMPATTVLIQFLAWELPYASRASIEGPKKKKKKKKKGKEKKEKKKQNKAKEKKKINN